MRTFHASVYIRNGKAQTAGEIEVEAGNFHVAAARAAKLAVADAKKQGIKRPKMIEVRITAIKTERSDGDPT